MNDTIKNKIAELEQKALAGDAATQYECGLSLVKYMGRKQRDNTFEFADKEYLARAIEWIEKAANQGNFDAQAMLGLTIFSHYERAEKPIKYIENKIHAFQNHDAWNDSVQWNATFTDGYYTNMEKLCHYTQLLFLNLDKEILEKIKQTAFDNLVKAAQQNNVIAQHFLGVFYYCKGSKDTSEYQHAIAWFQKAADDTCPYSKLYLSHIYANGQGVAQDYEQASQYLESVVSDMPLPINTAIFNFICQGLSSDFLIAIAQQHAATYGSKDNVAWTLLDTLANMNYLDAAEQRIRCYIEGIYVNQCDQTAAELGDIHSQLKLAERYAHGLGVEKDELIAIKWYKMAAEQHDDTEARYQWIRLYMKNRQEVINAYCIENTDRKYDWVCEILDNEVVNSLCWLIATKNHKKALDWFNESWLKLVFPYIHGQANESHGYEFVFKWLSERYEKNPGDGLTQYCLGVLYATGKGTMEDKEFATKLLMGAMGTRGFFDERDVGFCDLVFNFAESYVGIVSFYANKERITSVSPDKEPKWNGFFLAQLFTDVKVNHEIKLRSVSPLLECYYYAYNNNYDMARQVLSGNLKIHGEDGITEHQLRTLGLHTLQLMEEKDRANRLLREKENEMLSFFTHTMRNALATAPQALRDAIELLGSDEYEKDAKYYKAINKIASLFSSLSLTDCLIDTLKQSISAPEDYQQAWDQDQEGEATMEWVIGSALRQSLNRMFFISDPTTLEKLTGVSGSAGIKHVRKSFIDEVLPLNMNNADTHRFFAWVRQHIPCLDIVIEEPERLHFGAHKTRFSLLFAITSELILNALKYWDGNGRLSITWQSDDLENFTFKVSNTCHPGAVSPLAGSHKGLAFIKRLMELLGDKARCDFRIEEGTFMATVIFTRQLMGGEPV